VFLEVAMMHDCGFGRGWGSGMFFGPIFMIAGPVLLIVLVVVLVRWLSSGDRVMRSGSDRVPTAREILDERFAKGEIQRDEYEERRRALGA
jgi:putative membrane protein